MIFRSAAPLAAALFLLAAESQAGDVYAVRHVKVDATAASAIKARDAALLQGYEKALARLLRRLTLPEDWPRLPKLSGRAAQSLAFKMERGRVKTSRTRYIAEFAIHFDPQRIRALLRSARIPYSSIQARRALLIPLYETQDGDFLWQEDNPWRSAFAARDLDNIPTPLLMPVGDVADSRAISPEAVRSVNANLLLLFAQKYRAQHMLIARARALSDPNALKVMLTYLRRDASRSRTISFLIAEEEDPESLMPRAVEMILRLTADGWKRRALITHGAPQAHRLRARYESLEEWRRILKEVRSLPLLEDHTVRLIGRDSALIDIRFRGAPETLALALAQKEIRLALPQSAADEARDDPWTMTLDR